MRTGLQGFVPGQASLKSAGWEKIQEQVAANAATIDFVLPRGYRNFMLVWTNVAPATDAQWMVLRTSTDGGATFAASASDYQWSFYAVTQVPGVGLASSDTVASTYIEISATMGNATNEDCAGALTIFNPSAAAFCRVFCYGNNSATDGTNRHFTTSGFRAAAADVDAVRILMTSGNITSGTFTLYGLR